MYTLCHKTFTALLILTALVLAACSNNTRPIIEDQSLNKTIPASSHVSKEQSKQQKQQQSTKQPIIKPTTQAGSEAITAPAIIPQPTKILVTPAQPVDNAKQPSTSIDSPSKADTSSQQTTGNVGTPLAAPSDNNLPQSDQAVIESLLIAADKAKAQGDTRLAIIKLQQSQRIAPNEPKVYARLAALYMTQNQPARAEQIARKGITLVGNNSVYLHYFWRLIAACKRLLGDTSGEKAAIKQANRYQHP